MSSINFILTEKSSTVGKKGRFSLEQLANHNKVWRASYMFILSQPLFAVCKAKFFCLAVVCHLGKDRGEYPISYSV